MLQIRDLRHEYAGRTVHETVLLAHERVTAVWRTLSA